jgi:hypothetical protein
MKASRARVIQEGLIAGAIGYVLIAIFFLVTNLVQGRPPFHTATLLGHALFGGFDPADTGAAAPALAYNGVHLLVMLAVGTAASWLTSLAERGPQLWYLAISLFIIMMLHLVGAAVVLGDAVRAELSAATVALAGILASVAMVAYLWRAHPRLRREFRENQEQDL